MSEKFKVGDRVKYIAGPTQYTGTVVDVRRNVKVDWDVLDTHWTHPKRLALIEAQPSLQ